MKRILKSLLALCIILPHTAAAAEIPKDAARYLRVLESRPHQAALFDRFQNAWLDERSSDDLQEFLAARAEADGGASHVLLARFHLRRGQDAEALLALGAAITAFPDDAVLRIERARVNARRLDFDAAVDDLEVARQAEDSEQALEAAKLLGQTRMRSGDINAAIEVWNQTLEAHPADEALLEDLVELAAAEGETAQALVFIERLLAATPDPYRKALREIRMGDLLGVAGKFDEALQAYGTTLSAVGQGSWLEREILAQVDGLFRRGGREAELKEHLVALAAEHPGRLLIHRQLAKLEADAGDLDAAVERFRDVLRRSPGERELREEFIRILADGDRVAEAAEELEKLIAEVPQDAALWLRMAALQHRAESPEKTLDALEKARALMGASEPEALRVAGLMLGYELEEPGVALLRERMAAPRASTAPAEMLAAYFGRTNRRDEALELLAAISATGDLDTLLRATSSATTLGAAEKSFEWLAARRDDFATEARFLITLVRSALNSEEPAAASADAMRLVRLATTAEELTESIGLAAQLIEAAEETEARIESLAAIDAPGIGERALHAILLERRGDTQKVDQMLGSETRPALVWFHTAVLERRGEASNAVERLKTLADTEEGRRAAFLRELAELQLRAGDREAALASANQWKLSAPGDRSAWMFHAEVLRQAGRHDEALREMRRAVARFDGDVDLSARMAQWHAERGEHTEAEAIFWRLYDDAQTPTDQLRWGAQLAESAVASGRTAELDERLAERARADRRSAGPLLARAELARLTRRNDQRRDLLMEAVRLQPQDIDLRMRIARIEEEAGEIGRAQAVLEEAIQLDQNDRMRRELAQLYLRGGEVEKGMHMLRSMIGGESADPRELERLAASMASAGYYEQATAMLRDGLTNGGDWRSLYMLASMLTEDGRELEAVPIFIDLLHAEGEIDGHTSNTGHRNWMGDQPEEVTSLFIMQHSAQLVSNPRVRHSMTAGGGDLFAMPANDEFVRAMALVRLFQIEARLGQEDAAALRDRIESSGVEHLDLMRDLATSQTQEVWTSLIGKYPEHPGIQHLALMYLQYRMQIPNIDDHWEIIITATENDRLDLTMRYMGATHLLARDVANETDFDRFLTITDQMLADESVEPYIYESVAPTIAALITDENVAESRRDALRTRLREMIEMRDDDGEYYIDGQPRLAAKLALDPDADRIAILNGMVARHHANPPTGIAAMLPGMSRQQMAAFSAAGITAAQLRQMMGNSVDPANFDLDEVRLTSIPGWIPLIVTTSTPSELGGMLGMIIQQENPIGGPLPTIRATDLLGNLDAIESPVLRAWVALRASDADAIQRTEAANSENPMEIRDLAILRLVARPGPQPDPVDRFNRFAELRALTASEQEFSQQIDILMLELASSLTVEERDEREPELRALLLRCRAAMGTQFDAIIAFRAREFGFDDLAERFTRATSTPGTVTGGAIGGAAGGAIIGSSPRRGGSSSSQSDPLEKIREFTAAGRPEAAAREAWRIFRERNNQNVFHHTSRPVDQIKDILDAAGIEALLALADPGESQSRTRRLEYVDLCELLGRDEERMRVLEALHTERPNDAEIAVRLAFSENLDDERVIELMRVASSSGEELARRAHEVLNQRRQTRDVEAITVALGRTAAWLENSEPEELAQTNLTWVSFHARQYVDRFFNTKFHSMIEPREDAPKPDKDAQLRAETAWRLMKAMLRHDDIAEAGFRLLHATRPPNMPDAQLDAFARRAITAAPRPTQRFGSSHHVFAFRTASGTNTSGDSLEQHTSSTWLAKRMSETDPLEVMPEAFLEDLAATSPDLATALRALAAIKDVESLEAFHQQANLDALNPEVANSLRRALAARAVTIDGAAEFFIGQLADLPDAAIFSKTNIHTLQGTPHFNTLIQTIIMTATTGTHEQMTRLSGQVRRILIGPDKDWPTVLREVGDRAYFLYEIEQAFDTAIMPPLAMVNARRILFDSGVPSFMGTHSHRNAFRSSSNEDPAIVEKFLEDAGLLADVADWRPPAVITADHEAMLTGRQRMIRLEAKSTFEESIRAIRPGASSARQALVSRLEAREEGKFGTLMVLAAMADGTARGEYTTQAFTTAAAAIAAMPKEQWENIAFTAEWLPQDALDEMPGELAELLGHVIESHRETLTKQVADVLHRLRTTPSDRPFDVAQDLITQIARHSIEDAVELFVEADEAFTRSLARSGRFSSWSSSDFQISMREQALTHLLGRDRLGADSHLALNFLTAITKSPSGSRLSYTTGSSGPAYLATRAAWEARTSGIRGNNAHIQQIIAWLEWCETLEDEQAAIAITGLIDHHRGANHSNHYMKQFHDRIRASEVRDSKWGEPALAIVGVRAWTNLNMREKQETRQHIASTLLREDIPTIWKLVLTAKISEIAVESTNTKEALEAIADIYQTFAGEDRSVVTESSNHIIMAALIQANDPDEIPAIRRIASAFWENTKAAKAAGHSTIPSELAERGVMLALLSDLDGATQILESVRSEMTGRFPVIITAIMVGEYELAISLMPPPGQGFPTWTTNLRRSAWMEESLDAFRAAHPNADPWWMLDTHSLSLFRHNGNRPEIEVPRFRNIIESFTALESTDVAAQKQTFLRLACLQPDHPAIRAKLSAHLEKGGYLEALRARRENHDTSRNRLETADLARIDAELHELAALWAIADGNTQPLADVVAIMMSPANHTQNFRSNNIRAEFRRFHELTAAVMICQIADSRVDGYGEAAEIFAKLAIHAYRSDALHADEIRFAARVARLMWHFAGTSEKFDTWLDTWPDGEAGVARSAAGGRHLSFLPHAVQYWNFWVQELSEDVQTRFLKTMFTHPGLAEYYPHNIDWRTVNIYGFREDKLFEFAENPPDDLIPKLIPSIAAYAGRIAAAPPRRQHLRAAEFYKKSIDASIGELFDHYRGSNKVEYARALGNSGQEEIAIPLLRDGFTDAELIPTTDRNRQRLLDAMIKRTSQ